MRAREGTPSRRWHATRTLTRAARLTTPRDLLECWDETAPVDLPVPKERALPHAVASDAVATYLLLLLAPERLSVPEDGAGTVDDEDVRHRPATELAHVPPPRLPRRIGGHEHCGRRVRARRRRAALGRLGRLGRGLALLLLGDG